jgi:stress response protein SCP2
LRREIARLKGEQIKLRKAENTLKEYQSGIAATKAQIDSIEADKAAFLTVLI